MSAQAISDGVPGLVLGKATSRAAELFGLKGKELALVIGVSEAMVSRVRNGKRGLDASFKEGPLAMLLVRALRSLDAQVGNSDHHCRLWTSATWKAGVAPCLSL